MAAPVIPPPPPGFSLDAPAAASPPPPPPPGFTLDGAGPAPLGSEVPQQPTPGAAPHQEPLGLWDSVKNSLGLDRSDPVVDMWLHGLKTAAVGAPEVALNTLGNTGTQALAGLSAPFAHPLDADAAANYITDFEQQNLRAPQGDNAKELTSALGEAFQPFQNIKSKLGETALDATGSPALATAADVAPDLALAMLGGPKAVEGAAELPKTPLKADPVINPKFNDLRDADIRFRPKDLKVATPGMRNKIPGEFREKLSGPQATEDINLHNQKQFTDIAAKELGVPDLTDASLKKAAEPAAKTYDMVESVLHGQRDLSPEFQSALRTALDNVKLERPRGETPTIVNTLGALRKRAKRLIDSTSEETQAKGYEARNLADDLEEKMGDELKRAGEPQLLKEYQDARQQFAKIHDVNDTTRAGQIDAEALYRLNQRHGGERLQGGLKLIADAAEHAPEVSKLSLKRAKGAGPEVPGSAEGFIKAGARKLVKAIPGVDIAGERFQNATFGKPNPARAESYGKKYTPSAPREPQQGDMVGEHFDLKQPAGAAGRFASPEVARDLGDVVVNGEPLAERAPPQIGNISDLNELLGLIAKRKK